MIQVTVNEIAVVGIALVGVLLLALFGFLRTLKQRRHVAALTEDKVRAEAQAREQARVVAKLRADERSLASLITFLPSVVRELNSANLDPRRVPSLIIQTAVAIFDPEQVLLFLTPSVGNDTSRTLHLRAHHGLEQPPRAGSVITFGAGKIGWVAEHRIEMAADDWRNLSRTEGNTIENNHPAFHLDLVGPLVHYSTEGERLLGILCIGKPGSRPRDPKLMLQLVTNLGSLALMGSFHRLNLHRQADNDGLTGLTNKRAFLRDFGDLMTTAEREARPLGVFIFDIDYFKRYNDTNGHLAGDDLLKAVARILRENVRPGDLAARYGGEEFIVAMPDTDGDAALEHAEKIRGAVEQFHFEHGSTQPHGKLTISGGVASFPIDGANGTELITHADQALYQAKGAGRNRVRRYRGVSIGDLGADAPDEPGWPAQGLAG